MRRRKCTAAVVAGVLLLLAGLGAGAETIVTSSGSVLQGVIEFGIPAMISVTTSTGDVFTVQRANLKSIRLPGEEVGEATVETFDGNILIGTIGGIPEVLGLRTASGDVQSVRFASIVEIRFEPAATTPVAPQPPVTSPPQITPPRDVDAMVQSVVDTYGNREGGLTLGLDTSVQLGITSKNGFGIPRFTIGLNALTIGATWRIYFAPSATRVERKAREMAAADSTLDLDELTVATADEITPFVLPYLHLGTSAFIIPEIGGGVLLRFARAIYGDIGASIDLLGLPWILIGVLIVF
jgi:hypothetical protein